MSVSHISTRREELILRSPRPYFDAVPAHVQFFLDAGMTSAELLANANSDVAQAVLATIESRLPQSLQAMIAAGKVQAVEVGSPRVGCYTELLSDGYLIVLQSGLKDFLYRVVRALTAALTLHDMDGQVIAPAALSYADAARVIAEVFWWFQGTGMSAGPHYSTSLPHVALATDVTFAAECFLISHELGHVNYLEGERLATGQRGSSVASEIEEVIADDFARRMLLVGIKGAGDVQLRYAGAKAALGCFELLEELGVNFVGPHQTASIRARVLSACLRSECATDDVWSVVTGVSAAFDDMLEQVRFILRNSEQYDATFTEATNLAVERFEALLNKVAAYERADQEAFNNEMREILSNGYSYALVDSVAAAGRSFFRGLAESSGKWMSETLRERRHVFAHLHKFVDQVDEPFRSVFGRALYGVHGGCPVCVRPERNECIICGRPLTEKDHAADNESPLRTHAALGCEHAVAGGHPPSPEQRPE